MKLDLSHVAGNLDKFSDLNEFFLVNWNFADSTLHIQESLLDVVNSIITPLLDRLNHAIAKLKSRLRKGLFKFMGLNAEHRGVQVVVGQVEDLISGFVVKVDGIANVLNASLFASSLLKKLLVVKQVVNQLFLIHIKQILVLFVLF